MGNRLNLVGKKFNKLKVIKFSRVFGKNKNRTESYFICKCDCGVIKEIKGSYLIQGLRSCGCYRPRPNNAYDIDEDYFKKINTEDRAYFFGLIATDGYIGKHIDNKCIRLELKAEDKHILDTFRKCLKTKKPISKIKRKNKFKLTKIKYFYSYSLSVMNVKMRQDLIDKGIANKKSYTLKFPTKKIIPIKLMRHYIRGVFDGDGSCSRPKKGYNPIVEFVGGSLDFLKGLKSCLLKHKINYTSIYSNLRKSPVSNKKYYVHALRIHPSFVKRSFKKLPIKKRNLQIKHFFNLIYSKSNRRFMLKSKYRKFISAMSVPRALNTE